jgi:hypothetical protein
MPRTRSIPIPSGPLACAALGPVAIGAILAARTADPAPLAATPMIVFGVLAVTAPALYIAVTAIGAAPPLPALARALGTALGAFGIALAGLVLPVAFLALSSVTLDTTLAATSAALGAAGLLAAQRLARELAAAAPVAEGAGFARGAVLATWTVATLGIAGDLWLSLAKGVVS